METNTVEGNWRQLKGKIQEKWGKLNSDEIDAFEADVLKGKGEQLAGKIQTTYGTAKQKVQEQIQNLKQACNC